VAAAIFLVAGFLAATAFVDFALVVRFGDAAIALRLAGVLLTEDFVAFFLVTFLAANLDFVFFLRDVPTGELLTALAFLREDEDLRTDLPAAVTRFLVVEPPRAADLTVLAGRFLGLKGLYPVNLGGVLLGMVGKSANCVKLTLLL
jgi:hypothetical protein